MCVCVWIFMWKMREIIWNNKYEDVLIELSRKWKNLDFDSFFSNIILDLFIFYSQNEPHFYSLFIFFYHILSPSLHLWINNGSLVVRPLSNHFCCNTFFQLFFFVLLVKSIHTHTHIKNYTACIILNYILLYHHNHFEDSWFSGRFRSLFLLFFYCSQLNLDNLFFLNALEKKIENVFSHFHIHRVLLQIYCKLLCIQSYFFLLKANYLLLQIINM